jgi:hypothetical protein
VGIVGIAYPDSVTTLRRSYFATPGRLYAAGALRIAMGLVLILAAPVARWPLMLRVFGAMMCLQGLSAALMGAEHARVVLEWESARTALLRVGAIVALVTGSLIAFAVTKRSSDAQRRVAP